MGRDYLRVTDVAALTGLSKSFVRNAIAAGDLGAVRVKGRAGRRGTVLIPLAAYDKWKNACFEKI